MPLERESMSRRKRLNFPDRVWPKFLGIYDSAEYCNLCYRSFKKAVEAGRIPYRKFGAVYRFDRDELDAFMRGNDYPYQDEAGSKW